MFLFLLIAETSALFYQLPAKRQQCFGVKVSQARSKIVGSFEVSGVSEGLRATLVEPTTSKAVWTSAEASGSLDVDSPIQGVYRLCFDSTVSRPQVLSFDVRVKHDYDFDSDAGDIATKAHTDKVADLVSRLWQRVVDIEEQQHHGITRGEVHRMTADSTSERVAWWTLTKIVVLAVCSLSHVFYVRSFFEVKRIV